MLPESLPQTTPYDPVEDPPGSIDPMGTVAMAEQLAEVLFPGMTARMWRARHLTFAALAALVAEHAADQVAGDEELRLEARLGLERLFVSAIARQERRDESWRLASRRLPGITLARRALNAGDQPLGWANFLKGQAINGPFGVIARLARNLDVIDDDNRLSRSGQELLLAWSAEQGLPGVLDEHGSKSPGAKWIKRLRGFVVRHVEESYWPPSGWWGWSELAEYFRPDELNGGEGKVIFKLLCADQLGIRRRCVDLLQRGDVAASYISLSQQYPRGEVDRQILVHQLAPRLADQVNDVDRVIAFTVRLLDAYEQTAGHLEATMRGLLWGLTHRGGRSAPSNLLNDPNLVPHLARCRSGLSTASRFLQACMRELPSFPIVIDTVSSDRLDEVLQDALNGLEDEGSLVDSVMERHRRVQQQKKKGVWIESDAGHWTLTPGFGDNAEAPWFHDGAYLHPFRVSNAYSLLTDLGHVKGAEIPDAEEE